MAPARRRKMKPSAECLKLHNEHLVFNSFDEFKPSLINLLHRAGCLPECVSTTKILGIIEPLTGKYIEPEKIDIRGTNYRETIEARGCLSRNRALLLTLENAFEDINLLKERQVYLTEGFSGFAIWIKNFFRNVTFSEYFDNVTQGELNQIQHQDICNLSFKSETFDIVIANEVFEHVYNLRMAIDEVYRVLRPNGRLFGTFPMAFGQKESIVRAHRDELTGVAQVIGIPERHGDPIRPNEGSLVYQIPGWEILDMAKQAGFQKTRFHHITSWKHGVFGSDIPGVLVLECMK